MVAAGNPYFGLGAFKAIRKELKRKKWRQFYKELWKLKHLKRVNVSSSPDGTYAVEIAQMGKSTLIKYDLDNLSIKPMHNWDGYWRLFFFDIPADKKGRHSLLAKLRELGFVKVQKSLWAHPFECREELAVISKAFEVEPYVKHCLAYDFDTDWKLIKDFERINGIKLKDRN